ncbi:alpha-amylase family glycosyl hydrolase [Roseivivax sp. CAU 1761]
MSATERDAELIYALTHQGAVPDPPEWWRGAMFYEIYLRSFNDTTGSGSGDLRGVIDKLDYIRDLGVDGLWLSPFFASPQEDGGYDVSDFRAVHPEWGDMAELEALIAAAHDCGLRILSDFVFGHTSDAHAWFEESRQSRDNPKADWYLWADPAPDGTAPNNWLSSFQGRAWRWEPRRAQYCYVPFLKCQPALDLGNPEVVAAMSDNMRFWFEKGIDGFRLDAVQCLRCDPALRSNPPARDRENPSVGGGPNNPFKRQIHLFDRDVPEAIPVIKAIREVAKEFDGDRVLIGELADVDSSRLAPKYTAGADRLHAVYDFDLINRADSLRDWSEMLDIRSNYLQPGCSLNVLTNHDSERAVSNLMPRACAAGQRREAAKVLLFLQATLMGGSILYQGEELGLEQPELAYEDLRDPWALSLWPDFTGRDGVRCPMPWQSGAKNCGFSDSDAPWHRVPAIHCDIAVDRQEQDPDSVLTFTRRLLAWRRGHDILRSGTQKLWRDGPERVIAFSRFKDGADMVCVANFGMAPVETMLPREGLAPSFSGGAAEVAGKTLRLGPLACAALR